MKSNLLRASLIALCVLASGSARGDLVDFTFLNNSALDGSAVVGTPFVGTPLGTSTATLTTLDIVAPEFIDDVNGNEVRSGVILSAAAGDGVVTSINSDALGVNNQSINNDDFDTLSGPLGNNGAEGNDLNPDEGIFFTFDQDVIIQFVEFESVDAIDTATLSIGGTDLITLTGQDGVVTSLGSVNGQVIAAGTSFGIVAGGNDFTTDFRIESIQVDVINAIPEPSSLALVGLLGMGIASRRRR